MSDRGMHSERPLMNMREFIIRNETVRKELQEKGIAPSSCFIFFNIAQFKLYNASFGITQGDAVLLRIGEILLDVFDDAEDKVSRFADDHFVVSTKASEVEAKIRNVQKQVRALDPRFALKFNAGIYYCNDTAVPSNVACDLAKRACDSLRNDAVKAVCVYDASFSKNEALNKHIIDHIDEAVEKGWIHVWYQPVIRSLTGKLCSMEALTRWIDPEEGFISPAQFVPALESAHLIHHLDHYVIEQACRHIRKTMDAGETPVPVSFNLSRFDFLDSDPVTVIEANVQKYDIPRDYLPVEITESILMSDPELIRNAMDRLHACGYEIWMDDFGSGYSSLNVLKDFDFDEIKIDMMFMSSFNERTKTILSSIVSMAKGLKIQTLAEGVETKEQFDFLREIGCEKIQGYYFGRPMEVKDFDQNLIGRKIGREPRALRHYYTQVGRVELMSSHSLALIEDDDGRYDLLFENERYRELAERLGSRSIGEGNAVLNDSNSALHQTISRFFRKTESSDGEQSIVYPDRGQMVHMTASVAAHFNRRCMLKVSIEIEQSAAMSKRQNMIDTFFRNCSLFYEGAAVMHVKEDYLDPIIREGSMSETYPRIAGLEAFHQHFLDDIIAPEDRERYDAMCRPDGFVSRIRGTGRGFIAGAFRTWNRTKEKYEWKVHNFFIVPNTDDDLIICLIMPAIEEHASDMTERKENGLTKDLILDTIMQETGIKYFWKDTKRRFQGGSRSFLDYYGLDSIDRILNKDDEAVGWTVDGTRSVRSDEWDVLEKGKKIRHNHVQNVVKGSLHNLVVSKYPVYNEDTITGMVGWFFDADQDAMDQLDDLLEKNQKDTVTGLLSARTCEFLGIRMEENWRLQKNDYAVSLIDVPEFTRIFKTYGQGPANELLRRIGSCISSGCDHRDMAGRLGNAMFVIYSNEQTRSEISAKTGQIIHAIENIHDVNGIPLTLFADAACVCASETRSLEELNQTVLKRLQEARRDRRRQ